MQEQAAAETEKKKADKILIISGAVIALFVVALFTNGFGLFNNSSGGQIISEGSDFVKLEIGNAPVLGDSNAPITIYEFSDFSCPYCAAAEGENPQAIQQLKSKDATWEPSLPNIKEDYIDTGKVKLVYKYMTGHGTGQAAHSVAWCLNDQGLFWKFKDKAFANQADVGNLEKMKTLAQEVGADMNALNECLNSGKYNLQFSQDEAMGTSNGVQGTPSYFVNGKMVSGAIPYSSFKKIIDAELKG